MKVAKLIILSCILFSCNQNQNKNVLSLSLDTVIKHNDSINVFYTTDNTINFIDKHSFWSKVKGNSKNQTIQIAFPDSIKPKQIRIDFGNNINNQEIVLNKICISYLESSFEAKGEEIYWHFRPDENNTVLDKKNGVLKRINPTQINGPSIYPKGDKLKEQLNLLYKKEADDK